MATEPVVRGQGAEPQGGGPAAALLAALGERLVAVTAGVDDAELVRQWARGERTPPPEIAERLRTALEIVELLGQREGPGTIRAWWIGMNPDLGNQAPALVLHKRPDYVRDAALAFLAG